MQSLLPKMKVPKLPSFLKRKNTSTSQRAREPSTPLLITPPSPLDQAESRINTGTTQTTNNRFTESPKRSRSEEDASPSSTRSLRSTLTSSTSSYHELSESLTSLHRRIPINDDNPNPFHSPGTSILDTARTFVRSEGNDSQIVKASFGEPAIDGRDRLRGMKLMVGEAKVKEGEAKRMLKQSRDAVKGLEKDLKKVAREEKIEKKKQKKADKTKAKEKGKGKEMS